MEHLERLSNFCKLFFWLFRSVQWSVQISSNCTFANEWVASKNANFRETLDFWIRSESKVSTSCACMVSSHMTSVEGRHNGRSCGVVCCAEASHFSGKMSRLVLICGPIVSVACGNLVLQFLDLGVASGSTWGRDVSFHPFAVTYPGNLLKKLLTVLETLDLWWQQALVTVKRWVLQFGGLEKMASLCLVVKYASLTSTTYGYPLES